MGSSLILQGGAAVAKTLKESITQLGHGFSVGDVIRWDPSAAPQPRYIKAQADTAINAEVAGVVNQVDDPNNFQVTYHGYIELAGLAGISAPVMFLSSTVGGSLEASPPSAMGTVIKPILTKNTTGSGYLVMNYLGTQIGGSSTIAVDEIQPVGTIMPYAGSVIPDTWLNCNGSSYSVAEYPELYSKIRNPTGDRAPLYGYIAVITGNFSGSSEIGDIVQYKSNTNAWTGDAVSSNAELVGDVISQTASTITVKVRYNYSSGKFLYPNKTFGTGTRRSTGNENTEYRVYTNAGVVRTNSGVNITAASISHFNTPDLRGRFTLGYNSSTIAELETDTANISGIGGYTLGVFGGEEAHTITQAEMPAHFHDQFFNSTPTLAAGAQGQQDAAQGANSAAGVTTGTTGGNQPHNNMPPYLAVQYIIKAKPYTRAAIIDGIDLPYSSLLIRDLRTRAVGGSNTDLLFHTNSSADSGYGTERMRLTTGGTLGIGVTSGFGPTYSVQIAGNVQSTGTMVMSSASGYRNKVINGAMEINQRNYSAYYDSQRFDFSTATVTGYTATNSGQFIVDRVILGHVMPAGFAVQGTQQSDAPPKFCASSQIKVITARTSGTNDGMNFDYRIEGFDCCDMAWGTSSAEPVTLSFWAKTSVAGDYHVVFTNKGDTRNYIKKYTMPANTWTRVALTVPGDVSGTWLVGKNTGLRMFWTLDCGSGRHAAVDTWHTKADGIPYMGGSTQVKMGAVANATFQLTAVQLELGTVATPFERRSRQLELQMCQRYYEVGNYMQSNTGINLQSNEEWIQFKVVKLKVPVVNVNLVAESLLTYAGSGVQTHILLDAKRDGFRTQWQNITNLADAAPYVYDWRCETELDGSEGGSGVQGVI